MQKDKLEPPLRARRPEETARVAGAGELSGTEMLLGGSQHSGSSSLATSPLASAMELQLYEGGAGAVLVRMQCALLTAGSEFTQGARRWAAAA